MGCVLIETLVMYRDSQHRMGRIFINFIYDGGITYFGFSLELAYQLTDNSPFYIFVIYIQCIYFRYQKGL